MKAIIEQYYLWFNKVRNFVSPEIKLNRSIKEQTNNRSLLLSEVQA